MSKETDISLRTLRPCLYVNQVELSPEPCEIGKAYRVRVYAALGMIDGYSTDWKVYKICWRCADEPNTVVRMATVGLASRERCLNPHSVRL